MSTDGRHAAPRFRRFRVWPRPTAKVPAQEAPTRNVDYDTSYDDPRWGTEPAPAIDDTMTWRIPAADGGPGYVIPHGLPQRTPGAAIPPALVPELRTEPADPALLREVIDKLKALPSDPAPPRPVAWLRVHEDGREAVEALHGMPEFAGTDTLPDGTVIAGAFLGTNGRATWLFDAVDPAQVRAAITALTAVHDALVAAQGGEAEGTEGEAAA